MAKYLLGFTFLSFLILHPLQAQIHLDIIRNSMDVRMDQVLINEGYGNPAVYNIIQDHNGYMWFSSEASLYKYNGYTFEIFYANTKDSNGFVGNYPSCLYEDSDGHIWLGTWEGLSCLDPETKIFTHYYLDSTDLTIHNVNNIVNEIYEDHTGLYWLITQGNIYSLDKQSGRIKEYQIPNPVFQSEGYFSSWFPGRFLEDSEGEIWIPNNKGLYKYLRDNDKFTAFYGDSLKTGETALQNICSITEDTEGGIWYGTIGNGLHRIIDKETGEMEKFQFEINPDLRNKFDSVVHIAIGPDSCLWVAGWGWFARIDYRSNEQDTYIFHNEDLQSDGIFYVSHDGEGNIWFYNDIRGILYRFNPLANHLSEHRIWASTRIGTDCIRDASGAFWVGTAYGYVFRFDPYSSQYWFKGWRDFYPEGFTGRYLRIIEDKNGTKWVNAKGMFQLENTEDFNKIQLVPFKFSDNYDKVISGTIDKDQFLWFVHPNGILRKYDTEKSISVFYNMMKLCVGNMPDDLDFNKTQAIVRDTSGRIWWMIGGVNYLVCLDPGLMEVSFVKILESGSLYLIYRDMVADQSGNIWIASFTGICRLDTKTLKAKWYQSDHHAAGGLRDNSMINVEEDPFGNIWCLSYHSGVYQYKDETDKFEPFLPLQSEYNPYADILVTPDSVVWASTYGSILRYDLQLERFKTIKLESNLDYGALSQMRSGKIFMFRGGLYAFPNNIELYKIHPRIQISGMKINETDYKELISEATEISKLRNIELRHNENFLRFEYVGLSYVDQDLNKYRYWLQGADPDTIEAGTRTFADYYNLKPGKYTFWVTACNRDGIWNSAGVSMDIRIFPPWYGSVLAYIFYGIMLFLSILGFIRWRTRRLRLETEKLEKQVRERTITVESQKEEILAANEDLEQQKEELQITLENLKETQNQLIQSEKLAALGGLVAGVAHEINTPVGISVTAASSMAEETGKMADLYKQNKISRTDFKDYLNIANQSARLILTNMEKAATMIQSFKQVSVDQSTEQNRRFKLKEYTEDVIRSLYPRLKDKKIDIILDIDEMLELDSYPGAYSQVLSNLFLNSVVHGFINQDDGEITISAKNHSTNIEIIYKDNGLGISEENLEKIFDPFFTTNKKLGTGLGLHIVYNLVSQKLMGTISCDSVQGKGVSFRIEVPIS